MTNRIAFVDTETLGLDPDRHAIWEVGLVLYDADAQTATSEHLWQLQLSDEQIEAGDPVGMEIGRFDERYEAATATSVENFLFSFIELTRGTHLAGAVVSFDEERLRRLAASHGREHAWHYHLIDVEVLALGYWSSAYGREAIPLPWKSDWIAGELDVEISEEDRHTALGDARWAMRMYEAIR